MLKPAWSTITISLCIILSGCGQSDSTSELSDNPAASGASVVTTERLVNASAEPHNWLTHGGTYLEQRYSPLSAINASNVGELGLAWYYDLPTKRGLEATPLVVDGVMYTSTAWSLVFAFVVNYCGHLIPKCRVSGVTTRVVML